MRALATVVAVLALAAPAQAQDVFRLDLGDSLDTLVASPDGGLWASAWVADSVEIRRVEPDGSVRAIPAHPPHNDLILGPDERPWLITPGAIERIDATGQVVGISRGASTDTLATGPDGTAWMQDQDDQIQRLAPDGTISTVDVTVPGCRYFRVDALARASDDAMWFFANGCGVVRWPHGGAPAVIARPSFPIEQLVPDAASGMWFRAPFSPAAGHIDVAGRTVRLRGLERSYDVAVAPDGTAWFATGRCRLARANADGTVTLLPSPIPSWQLELAPDGRMWLGSGARLQRITPGAPAAGCDSTLPKVTITPKPAARVSLAALRRHRGLTITVREPFAVLAWLANAEEDPFTSVSRAVPAPRGGTVRLRISSGELRRLARTRRPVLDLRIELRDREGNYVDIERRLQVTR